jgi:hypothetical protein
MTYVRILILITIQMLKYKFESRHGGLAILKQAVFRCDAHMAAVDCFVLINFISTPGFRGEP